ncbi:MAG: pentapeptide repeat-containing protein [Planctomycetia bacterium]|nr:pentapeptide repeat-containing protein [Planctomycetia bacterium]
MSHMQPIDPNVRPDPYQPPRTVEELLARYAKGERYFAEADLPDGAVLSGANLEGANLQEAWLSDADFRGANLRTVDFSNSNLKCANFQGADLDGASFQGASIESADFQNTNWLSASFAGATAYGYTLKEEDKVKLVADSEPSPSLFVLKGENKNLVFAIRPGRNIVGRSGDRPVDIDLRGQEPSGRVWSSTQHCLIFDTGNELLIEDLNSANGTYVNRMRVAPGEKRRLVAGDVIQVGVVQLRLNAPANRTKPSNTETVRSRTADSVSLSKTV